jgi:hypothetical protein
MGWLTRKAGLSMFLELAAAEQASDELRPLP